MIPRVSIIVIVYNGERTLPNCLDSLMNLDFSKDEFEIIVVDNNSTDATKEIIKRYPVKYVFEKKKGRATARNRGIREAKGEFVTFTDADCVVDRLWLTNLIKGFTDEMIGGCGGEFQSCKPQSLIEKYCDFKCHFFQRKGLAEEGLFLPRIGTGNAIYKREVLEGVGLFDETFINNEDVDLSWRVYLKGYQLNYVPDAIVYHKPPNSLIILLKNYFEYGYTYAYLTEKYKRLMKGPFLTLTELFSYQLQSTNKIFHLFDIISKIVYFLGRIYGTIVIKLGIRKISRESKPNNNIFWRIVDKQAIVQDIERDSYYVLNEIATTIWMLLKEGKYITEIIEIITHQYKVNKEEIKSDLVSFIDELKRRGLVLTDKLKNTYVTN